MKLKSPLNRLLIFAFLGLINWACDGRDNKASGGTFHQRDEGGSVQGTGKVQIGESWRELKEQVFQMARPKNNAPKASQFQQYMPQAQDHTDMWWRDGFPGRTEGADWRRIVKTGKYRFFFDTDTMRVARLGVVEGANTGEVDGAKLELKLMVDGKPYVCKQGGTWAKFVGPRLIESGRFMQRADVTGLVFKDAEGAKLNVDARIETAAWHDQLVLTLAARPGLQLIKPGDESFGLVDGGFGLDGSNEFVLDDTGRFKGEAFTLDFWAYIPIDFRVGEGWPWLVCKNRTEREKGSYGVVIRDKGIPELVANPVGGKEHVQRLMGSDKHALRFGRWNHVSLGYVGRNLHLRINSRSALVMKLSKPFDSNEGELCMGDRGSGRGIDNNNNRFRGVVDQVRYYNKFLDQNAVDHLYRFPQEGLPRLKPVVEHLFRSDVKSAKTQPAESWRQASIEISLSKGKDQLQNRWDLPSGKLWDEREWRDIGIRFDPVSFKSKLAHAKVDVKATEVATGRDRPVSFDLTGGYHRVSLDDVIPIPPKGERGPSNDSIERVRLQLSNPSSAEQIARMVFEKTPGGFRQKIGVPITGISAVLRDAEGYPTGIPVQLSKNWHYHPADDSPYTGQWFHGISQVRLPAKSVLELELTIAYGHWGGVAAASHSQLSLIGWGGNQRWDQSALGSWGESICYSPEQNEASCTITDVRPILVTSYNERVKKYRWTHNVGGGDFLRLFDLDGKRLPRSGVSVNYRKQCPCLTEVKYSGNMRGANISHSQVVSIGRTDDLVCGTYQIGMRVHEPVDFSRFAIFQIGSDKYASTRERKLAFGDESGLIKEWDAQWGGNTYKTKAMECNGRNSWVSLHETEGSPGQVTTGAWANRGFVIRKWHAQLGGKKVRPWVAEWGLDKHGRPTSIMEVVPPPGVTRLEKGDFIFAVIDHVVIPQHKEDYYGANQSLQAALAKDADTWKMVHRQAAGDRVVVKVEVGELKNTYPDVSVEVRDQQARYTLKGGLGYVPLTFTGLTAHRGYELMVDGQPLDQSVHGNDFWQTDYDSELGRWSRTYNIATTAGKRHVISFAPKKAQ